MSIIRQQRHLSSRVLIATQEPDLDTRLLDLCNVTVVHQFNSPDWYRVLKKHLAGTRTIGGEEPIDDEIFSQIVDLPPGSALLFSPKAMLHVESEQQNTSEVTSHTLKISRLKHGYIKIKMRERITQDGGNSIMADEDPNNGKSFIDSRLGDNDKADSSAASGGFGDLEGGSRNPPGQNDYPQYKEESTDASGAEEEEPSDQGGVALPTTAATTSRIKPVFAVTSKLVERAIRSHVEKQLKEGKSASKEFNFMDVRRAVKNEVGGISKKQFEALVPHRRGVQIISDHVVSVPSRH